MANEYLALAYDDIDSKTADRLRGCVPWLKFKVLPDGKKKLHQAFFCKVRLCPVCTWRRSLKAAVQMRSIMEYIAASDKPLRYLFLTLTVRNCEGDQLSETITKLLEGFQTMTRRVDFKGVARGWYRALEVTHDVSPTITEVMYQRKRDYCDTRGLQVGDENPNFDMYHPHLHVVVAVDAGYFSGGRYKKHEEWVAMWASAMSLGYRPSVDVRTVKGDTASAVAEAAKYSVKATDYICLEDWDLTVETVRLLDAALRNRQLVAYGGRMREVHKLLKMDKPDEGDLVHVDVEAEASEATEETPVFSYAWVSGYSQYVKD